MIYVAVSSRFQFNNYRSQWPYLDTRECKKLRLLLQGKPNVGYVIYEMGEVSFHLIGRTNGFRVKKGS